MLSPSVLWMFDVLLSLRHQAESSSSSSRLVRDPQRCFTCAGETAPSSVQQRKIGLQTKLEECYIGEEAEGMLGLRETVARCFPCRVISSGCKWCLWSRSVSLSVGRSVCRSVGQSVCRSVCRLPVGGLVNRLVYFPVFFTFSLMNDEHTVPDILRLLAK